MSVMSVSATNIRQYRCSICKQSGHNKRGCPDKISTTRYSTSTTVKVTMDIYYEDVVYVTKIRKECAICLEPLVNDTINKTVCKHYFHQLCLWAWLMKKPECPWCRTTLGVNELTLVTIDEIE